MTDFCSIYPCASRSVAQGLSDWWTGSLTWLRREETLRSPPPAPELVIFPTFFPGLLLEVFFFSLSTRSAAIYGLLNGAKSVARTMVSIKVYIVTFKAAAREIRRTTFTSILNAWRNFALINNNKSSQPKSYSWGFRIRPFSRWLLISFDEGFRTT